MRTALAAALLLSASVLCAADTAARPALRVKREVTKSAVVEKAAPVELRGGGAADVLSKISLPREVQLLIASAGIFMSFSFFAIKQEDVYKRAYGGEYFAYTFFALVIERGINALVALVGMMALGKSGLRIPHLDIFNSGVSQVVAMAASNEALRYVSYPTQVLGKSCKMVPVMAGGIVLGGKTYSTIEYLQVLMITTGVVVFNFGGKKKGGGAADSAYGLVLIGLSLIMDMVCTARAHMHVHTCTCPTDVSAGLAQVRRLGGDGRRRRQHRLRARLARARARRAALRRLRARRGRLPLWRRGARARRASCAAARHRLRAHPRLG